MCIIQIFQVYKELYDFHQCSTSLVLCDYVTCLGEVVFEQSLLGVGLLKPVSRFFGSNSTI